MDAKTLLDHFDVLVEAPGGVAKIRAIVLDVAIQGKLVPQNVADEHATVLLERLNRSARRGQRGDSRFQLPASWCWARFDDVAIISSNLVQPQGYEAKPHVAPNNIEKGTGKLLPYRSVGEDGVRSGKHLFFAGQLLYSKIRPNLSKAVLVDFDGLCSADMYPITALIDSRYLLTYILSSWFLEQVTDGDNRIAMPKVNQDQLNAVLVAVPPLAEQRRIVAKVEELMTLCDQLEASQERTRATRGAARTAALHAMTSAESHDDVERAWRRLLAHWSEIVRDPEDLQPIRQAVLELAMQGRLVPQDPNEEHASMLLGHIERERHHQKTKKINRLVKDKLPMLPSGWVWTSLEVLLVLLKNGIATRPQGEAGIPILRISAVRPNMVSLREVRFLSGRLEDYKGFVIEAGDLLFTRFSGNAEFVGACGVVPPHAGPIVHPDKIIRGVVFQNLVESRFISLAMSAGASRAYVRQCGRTTAGNVGISGAQLKATPIPLPPLAEQRRIVAKVDEMMVLCNRLEQKIRERQETAERLVSALVAAVSEGRNVKRS